MNEAPWFEDFVVGADYSQVPSVTITEGYTVIHQAIFGDRLRLPLDHRLSKAVLKAEGAFVNPSLVCNLAIGQTTIASQRVMGNLFYRGLLMHRPVFVGDTLTTSTSVIALRQNRIKPGRAASGMVALEMHVKNHRDETIMLFWRCPMIACKDPEADTGHADDFDIMPSNLELPNLEAAAAHYQTHSFKELVSGDHFTKLEKGDHLVVDARDTVTLAPELVRLTLNMAMTHTDAQRSVYGRRLVYGGHTISMAAAQVSRAMPNLMTILGWIKCDHVAPVFEQDILRTEITIENLHPLSAGGIAMLHVETFATRGSEAPEQGDDIKVLDWRLATLFA
jgi:acyl dehydratase